MLNQILIFGLGDVQHLLPPRWKDQAGMEVRAQGLAALRSGSVLAMLLEHISRGKALMLRFFAEKAGKKARREG